MNFNWKYVSTGGPYITVTRYGLQINETALSLLGNPSKILIGFDSDTYAIGVKPYEGEENTKPYSIDGRIVKGWVKIGCKDFIRVLSERTGIQFNHAARYRTNSLPKNIIYINIRALKRGKRNE